MPHTPWAALNKAYCEAQYLIDTNPPVMLRIGHVTSGLERLLPGGLMSPGVFLTACNPHSRRLCAAVNRRRMQALERAVSQLALSWLRGRGIDPRRRWPDEPSLWIPGLPLPAAHQLAARFRQNAFLWCDEQSLVHLIWTDRQPLPGHAHR